VDATTIQRISALKSGAAGTAGDCSTWLSPLITSYVWVSGVVTASNFTLVAQGGLVAAFTVQDAAVAFSGLLVFLDDPVQYGVFMPAVGNNVSVGGWVASFKGNTVLWPVNYMRLNAASVTAFAAVPVTTGVLSPASTCTTGLSGGGLLCCCCVSSHHDCKRAVAQHGRVRVQRSRHGRQRDDDGVRRVRPLRRRGRVVRHRAGRHLLLPRRRGDVRRQRPRRLLRAERD
jgi:hypothetical protein